ncbi:MAG: PAC2 family protein [Nanoarchaeota archaeon]
MVFTLIEVKKKKLTNPILIEGLPGIGNVGKIAADFMIDSLNAQKIIEIHSYNFPHAVLIDEDNLVQLPVIEIYYKHVGKHDLIFLIGDIQPIDEESSYEFCEVLLKFLKSVKCKEIITLGGIGLHQIPNSPKVFVTGNDKKAISSFNGKNISKETYNVVGPIVGVTGLLIGLSIRWGIPGVALLGETYGHPQYLGIKGAREIIMILNKRYGMNLQLKELNSEISNIEKEISSKLKQLGPVKSPKKWSPSETSYIG